MYYSRVVLLFFWAYARNEDVFSCLKPFAFQRDSETSELPITLSDGIPAHKFPIPWGFKPCTLYGSRLFERIERGRVGIQT